uniref:tRNA intron endonuclease N-terminal domain-containing protein n=1 Tax=Parascaris equorum TaxID=6256 RepID=A0A914RN37_PAREQ
MESWANMISKDRRLRLGMEEAMYLMYDLNVLEVSAAGKQLSVDDLWRRFYSYAGTSFVKRYACYRSLRRLGWVVRPDCKMREVDDRVMVIWIKRLSVVAGVKSEEVFLLRAILTRLSDMILFHCIFQLICLGLGVVALMLVTARVENGELLTENSAQA